MQGVVIKNDIKQIPSISYHHWKCYRMWLGTHWFLKNIKLNIWKVFIDQWFICHICKCWDDTRS